MFGVSGVPALFFLIMLFIIPRSPRWLVTQSNLREALDVLRLTGIPEPKQELDEIVASVHLERSSSTDPLFSRQYKKPIIIAWTVGMFSQLSGINAILYYLKDIFALAGASRISGNLQAIAVGATNLVATLLALTVIDKLGRKKAHAHRESQNGGGLALAGKRTFKAVWLCSVSSAEIVGYKMGYIAGALALSYWRI